MRISRRTAVPAFPPSAKQVRRKLTDTDEELYRQAGSKQRSKARVVVQKARRNADPMKLAAGWGIGLSGTAVMMASAALIFNLPGTPEPTKADVRATLIWLMVLITMLCIWVCLCAWRVGLNFARRYRADTWHDAYRHIDGLEREVAEQLFRQDLLAVAQRQEHLLDRMACQTRRPRERPRIGWR